MVTVLLLSVIYLLLAVLAILMIYTLVSYFTHLFPPIDDIDIPAPPKPWLKPHYEQGSHGRYY